MDINDRFLKKKYTSKKVLKMYVKIFQTQEPQRKLCLVIELRPKLSADEYNNSPEGGHPLVMQDVSNTQVALMTNTTHLILNIVLTKTKELWIFCFYFQTQKIKTLYY